MLGTRPELASQGDGIALCTSFNDLQIKMGIKNSPAVVQKSRRALALTVTIDSPPHQPQKKQLLLS